ncbi:cyanophycinase [Nitrosomonas sp. Nm84]|uniref:cyanophycinase n=1 Tax=Nitrosomonas sp. Nm84 TaxID=200124 RepID=UPI000D76ABE6|nr:cyanophycinase [Nitrosomonas sp. Nm84]PXW87764.1 cyanophycinase [Nitrosomonas sp. Nm84]
MKRYLIILLLLTFSVPGFAAKQQKLPYDYFRVGNTSDVSHLTQPGTVLMGGGTDVDEAFTWMCTLSNNGDFLVIRATGTDAYNPYIRQLCPNGNSVATLIIPTREAANHEFVISMINKAEAIWIAGGDQSDYINFWKNTPLQAALNERIVQGVPIGGTSAGLDVLTQFIYSALANKGVTSEQALADPFHKYITLDRDFVVNLPVLAGAIGDAHIATRDRMGRNIAFLCRIYANGWSDQPRGISVDEAAALLIDAYGTSTIVGTGNAYFLQAPGAPEVCAMGSPLTYENIGVYRINAATSGTFDLWSWLGSDGSEYHVSAIQGILTSDQANQSPY